MARLHFSFYIIVMPFAKIWAFVNSIRRISTGLFICPDYNPLYHVWWCRENSNVSTTGIKNPLIHRYDTAINAKRISGGNTWELVQIKASYLCVTHVWCFYHNLSSFSIISSTRRVFEAGFIMCFCTWRSHWADVVRGYACKCCLGEQSEHLLSTRSFHPW